MMGYPRILCTMLAAGRQAMVDRAIRSWHCQTWPEDCRALYILDNGSEPLSVQRGAGIYVDRLADTGEGPRPIGTLRNLANALSLGGALDCDAVAHWDSDDVSHPRRLEEQMALLDGGRVDVVGYREVLFWDSVREQAWIYSNANSRYAIGASLVYWRKTWQRYPFPPHKHIGEDIEWLMRVRGLGTSGLVSDGPRLVCEIHSSNTSSRVIEGAQEWQRAEAYDKLAQETMRP
jgi:hypothetical protein